MGRRIKYDEFIKKDIDFIVENANFTETQMLIFTELCKGSLYDTGICMKLNVSPSAYYRMKRKVADKIARVMQ
jgi:hypothetical protein